MNASIIGSGWVTPWGRDIEEVWQAIREERQPTPAPQENPRTAETLPVLHIPPDTLDDAAAFARLRRSSRISHLAVAAATDAATRADLNAEKLSRTALVFATSDGGVAYTRRFYADVVEHGEGSGSPLLFPETVYNAPASHIAARLGLTGEVLTLVGDAAAGLTAVRVGCELLATGEADFCLVVAAQELDGITAEAYARHGLIRSKHPNSKVPDRTAIFAEGAAAIVLAQEGGCRVNAPHAGCSFSTDSDAAAQMDLLIKAVIAGHSPELVVTSASGTRLDAIELEPLARHLPKATVLRPKFVLGEALSCSALQHVIVGAKALETSSPGTQALISALGFNGQIAALILTGGNPQG